MQYSQGKMNRRPGKEKKITTAKGGGWTGKTPGRTGQGNIIGAALQTLEDWVRANIEHPYPNSLAKEELSKATGLTTPQVIDSFNMYIASANVDALF